MTFRSKKMSFWKPLWLKGQWRSKEKKRRMKTVRLVGKKKWNLGKVKRMKDQNTRTVKVRNKYECPWCEI